MERKRPWDIARTFGQTGNKRSCVKPRRAGYEVVVRLPKSSGAFWGFDGTPISAASGRCAKCGAGLLPAVHAVSASDFYQRTSGPSATGCSGDSAGRSGVFTWGDCGADGDVSHLCGKEPEPPAVGVWIDIFHILPHAGHQYADQGCAYRLPFGTTPGGLCRKR